MIFQMVLIQRYGPSMLKLVALGKPICYRFPGQRLIYANTDSNRGGEFELTTGGDENVFIRDGKLVIKSTFKTKATSTVRP